MIKLSYSHKPDTFLIQETLSSRLLLSIKVSCIGSKMTITKSSIITKTTLGCLFSVELQLLASSSTAAGRNRIISDSKNLMEPGIIYSFFVLNPKG